jgi:CubicO group peptidase (beta-lactamase class C family)
MPHVRVFLWLVTISAVASAAPRFEEAVTAGRGMPRLYSLLASQHGELILEQYFHGARPATYANIKSASKSIISALVGIAIDRKLLPGVGTPIAPYFPELAAPNVDPRKRRITIEDLLTMRSGLVETNRGYGAWVLSPNWVHYLLAHPLQFAPGDQMNYNTGNTHLLSALLTKVSGSDTWSFAQKTLAGALGSALPRWPRDPQGIYFGGNDMLLTPLQMLKFGELYLHHGRAGDLQIVPAEWVAQSLLPRTRSPISGQQYGYGWWISEMAGWEVDFAWGFGGQYIFIVPSLDLVVVTTSSVALGEDRRAYRKGLFDLVENQIVDLVAASNARVAAAR